MKTTMLLFVSILCGSLLFLTGCESENGLELEPMPTGQLNFTSLVTRAANETGDPEDTDDYGNAYSDHNLKDVPNVVGAFARKKDVLADPDNDPFMINAIYGLSRYESGRPESNDSPKKLLWYRTNDSTAYWDQNSLFDIYAYAPIAGEESENEYYNISDKGVVSFMVDGAKGIPVDFIYAKAREKEKDLDADELHMSFQHKLCKIVIRLRNGTENSVTCYGVRYKIEYPIATFDLLNDEWTFLGNSEPAFIELRNEQYEIFNNEYVFLSKLTTLLFPVDAENKNTVDGVENPGNVIIDLEIALNNKWYKIEDALKDLNLKYKEGEVIVLTFNCKLSQGEENDDEWKIYSATFDTFLPGETIDGILDY